MTPRRQLTKEPKTWIIESKYTHIKKILKKPSQEKSRLELNRIIKRPVYAA